MSDDIEIDTGEDTGAEIATVETILEDEDDESVEAIVDVLPEDEGRPDE